MPMLAENRIHRARKDRMCKCGARIRRGEAYAVDVFVLSSRDDDNAEPFWTDKHCVRCTGSDDARSRLVEHFAGDYLDRVLIAARWAHALFRSCLPFVGGPPRKTLEQMLSDDIVRYFPDWETGARSGGARVAASLGVKMDDLLRYARALCGRPSELSARELLELHRRWGDAA